MVTQSWMEHGMSHRPKSNSEMVRLSRDNKTTPLLGDQHMEVEAKTEHDPENPAPAQLATGELEDIQAAIDEFKG